MARIVPVNRIVLGAVNVAGQAWLDEFGTGAITLGAATVSGTGTVSSSAFPDSTNTGPESHPSWPGSLTDNATTTISSSGTYNFQRFHNITVTGGTVVFNGCEFWSNDVADANGYVNGTTTVTFNNCRFRPKSGISIPNADWPAAGAGLGLDQDSPAASSYQIGGNDGYQYGVRIPQCTAITFNQCDMWGFGNAIDLTGGPSASNVTVNDSWIHDSANPDAQLYHQDGPGFLDGGTACSSITIYHCTIASLGNTNAIAMQAASGGYNAIVVDSCYLSGFGYTVDMCHGYTGAANCKFINNVLSDAILPVFGFLYGGETTVFAVTKTTNQWENNTVLITQNGAGYSNADSGKYIWPDGTVSATDYVDGFP